MITFQKSLAAALLSGAIAVVTPALAGGLLLAQAQTTAPSASGSATTNGTVTAQPDSAGAKANVNAAGAAKVSPDANNPTGSYGGMGTDQSTINKDVSKAKKKATTPMESPNNMSSPEQTTVPH